MINIHDIIDITDLTEDEVAAIAEHEGLPTVNAAALAQYVLAHHRGAAKVHDMIADDIREALHKKDLAHARDLLATLKHFIAEHPDAVHGVRT